MIFYSKRLKVLANKWKESILLEEFLKLSTVALEEENKRRTILEQKADYLFKWLTFVISIVGIIVPVVSKQAGKDINDKFIIWAYIVTMIFFIVAIICVITINWPRKRKLSILGNQMMSLVKQNNITDIRDVIYKEIMMKDAVTTGLRKENELKATLIILGNIFLVLGIISLAVLVSYFIWGM